ncbi:DNA modification methylase [Microbacterium rhizosphaerae]|uniref:DNA modification methylase n=1 Tax=Microbacterium rhizosphaerae TaxID=1678237 RepID=A0ABZ0SMD8_9MICO|nr:DNA modification methylase [Microbacterium rhizosphaerae]WPR88847.1 DNA modification methylase [Microbacterium rhizosphaerae]
MKSRLIASIVVGAAVILGATGCSMISPQTTTVPYSPSDGINVPDVPGAPLQVRNALVITNAGAAGNLVAAIVNQTDRDETLTINISDTAVSKTVDVPANSTVSLGTQDTPPLALAVRTKPGATVLMEFQSGDAQGVKVHVPVLNGTLPYYSTLVPTPPRPSASGAATASPTASPSPSATP